VKDWTGIDLERAVLLMMHFQADVFAVLFGDARPPLLDRANDLITGWRRTGRPLLFANFALGPNYEWAHPDNQLTAGLRNTGLFRDPTPVEGLNMASTDPVYACPRVSVFHGTSLDADLRAASIETLVMAGVTSSGVVLSSIAWASDADYRIFLVEDCCYDPDAGLHNGLFRTGFKTRATII
jgi:nicotinamidase-related amidase